MRTPLLAAALAACAGSPTTTPEASPTERGLRIAPVALSDDLDTRTVPTATTSATVDGQDAKIGYHVLFRTGQDGFGTLHDAGGKPIEEPCDEQDFNSLIAAHGGLFMLSHFECTPGGMYITRLSQSETGHLSPEWTKPVSFADVNGLWMPCAGQVTPWNTHLSSEEYEPDARGFIPETSSVARDSWNSWANMKRYSADLNPYDYGWSPEVEILDAEGATRVTKRLSPGRFSHEIAYVLPDQKTVYLSDDGSGTGWFLFVADKAADLSAGHLYAARWDQTSAEAGGRADLKWVPLGHSTDDQIQSLIDSKIRFDEIFDAVDLTDGACPDGYRAVHSYAYDKPECLRLAEPSERVPSPRLAASRLETRRFAAYEGATTEFMKGEGVTFDERDGIVYLALSRITGRMLAEEKTGLADHIQLPKNHCGAVYGGQTRSGEVDTSGAPIPSDLVMHEMHAEVEGEPIDEDAAGNTCAVEKIANPDNIAFQQEYGLLTIAEDSKRHTVNILWTSDREGALTRVAAMPFGAEATGIHWFSDLNGYGYLTLTSQHPWRELAKGKVRPEFVTDDDTRTFTGYIGPFPPLSPSE